MKHQSILLKDYCPPNYIAKKTLLHFDLHEESCVITSRVQYERQIDSEPDLELHGEDLELISVRLNDDLLDLKKVDYAANYLRLSQLPGSFELEIVTKTKPHLNTALEGLYKSNGKFCTQCEPEGFRRLTYFLDRPDVMSEFTSTIEADQDRYPVLLSNGNLIDHGTLAGGRHYCTWHDPFPKPSYLFALVAGNLVAIKDFFVTKSGRHVELRIYVEDFNRDKCAFAMESVKQSMKWDEEVYGLEYDLDIFMIVAVSDFNMGAMENKGLNIFNSKYILAHPQTATDQDFEAIQSVVGHEYFHNWTGNRVTCRDWFQLSLKEGLTVFRDQEFSADMTSRGVKRISDVASLRNSQFLEDSGPMAHPVRPDSFIEINNFYTSTVYNKGAEVIRMIHTILGSEGFHAGIRLYFCRHDGQAVTVEDFVSAMEDATGKSLQSFMQWYLQAGTPKVTITMDYDAQSQTMTLHLEQVVPVTPGQPKKNPHIIPIKTALFHADGTPMTFEYQNRKEIEHVLILENAKQEMVFHNIKEKPVPSFLRDFSAPVFLNYNYTKEDLRFLLRFDDNQFNRYESAQILATGIIIEKIKKGSAYQNPDQKDLNAFSALITDQAADPRLVAKTLSIPSVEYLTNSISGHQVESIFEAREWLIRSIAEYCKKDLEIRYMQCRKQGNYSLSKEDIANREMSRICLQYLTTLRDETYFDLAFKQYQASTNMTDTMNALSCLVHYPISYREKALADFYEKWNHDDLVLDKWFAVQSSSYHPDVLHHVNGLVEHRNFSILKPNRVYAVLRQFIRCNPLGFHHPSGEGYRLMADYILKIDEKNSQVASLLATALSQWQSFDHKRQILMKEQLIRIHDSKHLSKDTYEVVSKSLAEAS